MPLCVLNIIFAGYILERDKIESLAVSCLSEESVARGGAPVAVPDFTMGEYRTRKPRSVLRS